MEGASGDASEMFNSLPENCISRILSFTSPRDTCRFATLSSLFRSAAESDQVWAHFLPSNFHDMLSRADATNPIHFSSKKDLFFLFYDHILIDGGKNSIALDKTTGKVCYMISAKELVITDSWDDWDYPTLPESRFTNVGQQRHRCVNPEAVSVDAELRIDELSENTTYAVYLVYKLNATYVDLDRSEGLNLTFLDDIPTTYIWLGVLKEDTDFDDKKSASSCLISKEDIHQASKHLSEEEVGVLEYYFQIYLENGHYFPKEREGGQWMEVVLGEFLNENGIGEEKVFVHFIWYDCVNLDSFIIEGIEFRPKI